ncbi:MAG TPA: TIGR02302 family protein [Rhizomicrobium sp.]|jgi:uncharacterized protein (TIGR02302 family)
MTMHLSDRTGSRPGSKPERYIRFARAAILWERVWPALWPASGVLGLYAAAALLGAFVSMPGWLHALLFVAALGATGLSVFSGFQSFELPHWAEGARRVERDSALAHRPITEGQDRMALGSGDAVAESLWRAHVRWLLARIGRLRLARPAPHLSHRDPYALRFVVLLLLIAGVFVAGHDWSRRLIAAFSLNGSEGGAVATMDAWVNPPAYTGEAPLYLDRNMNRVIAVPTGSELVLRVHSANSKPAIALDPAPQGKRPDFKGKDSEFGASYRIVSNGTVSVRADSGMLGNWQFKAIPDNPPIIAFANPPSKTASDALKISFTAGDDYGVVSARAIIRPLRAVGKQTSLSIDLPLAAASAKTVTQSVYRDLRDNPFAGLDVEITLEAKDGAGQIGRSKPVRFHLPAQFFTNPLARALVEQRQNLSLGDPQARGRASRALEALTLAPELFYQNQLPLYLNMRTIYWDLRGARTKADIARIQDELWQLALALEQGEAGKIADQLRQIQQLLSQALAQGAPQDVIDQLLQRYRQTMQRYMQMLAQNPQSATGQPPPGARVLNISPEDLDKLLKAIQQAAQSGARGAAQQMLSMLQNLLENLHMQNGAGGSGSPGDKALSDAIQGLGDLMGRQRALMDKTYRQQQGAGDPKDGGAKGLAQQQQKLHDDLNKLLKGLGDQKQKAPQSLGAAGKAMGDAQNQLNQNSPDNANPSEQQALDALRQGTSDLAKRLMQENGQGQPGENGREDPLGRQAGSQGGGFGANGVKVPDKSSMERARAILQELRRRAAQEGRPKEELDYLDRLLKEF